MWSHKQIQTHCGCTLQKVNVVFDSPTALPEGPFLMTPGITLKFMNNFNYTCTHKMYRLKSAVQYPPMVQFVVIFLRFGLCRSNSSSLLVGSHVVYFSPMPGGTKKHKRVSGLISNCLVSKATLSFLTENKMLYLAFSRLSSVPLWQSAPCLCRICSLDTQNNIFHHIIGLQLEAGRKERDKERLHRNYKQIFQHSNTDWILLLSNLTGTASLKTSAFSN